MSTSTAEPQELFALHRILTGFQSDFRVNALQSLDRDLTLLRVSHNGFSANKPSTMQQALSNPEPEFDSSSDTESEDEMEDETDATYCCHRREWERKIYRSDRIIARSLKQLRLAKQAIEVTRKAARAIAEGYNYTKPVELTSASLARVMYLVRNIQDSHLDPLVGDLTGTLNKIGCVNHCQDLASSVLSSTDSHQPHQPGDDGEPLTRLKACQKVMRGLKRICRAIQAVDAEICQLHYRARQKWTEFDELRLGAKEHAAKNAALAIQEGGTTQDDSASTETDLAASIKIDPCQRFPVEVLEEIFLHGLDIHNSIPAILGSINCHLYYIWIKLPELWTFINVQQPLSFAAQHIIRSRENRLHVSLSLPPIASVAQGEEKLTEFCHLLTAQVLDRTRTFHAVTTEAAWTIKAVNLLQSTDSLLPEIETMDIGLCNPFGSDIVSSAFPSIANVSDLTVRHIQFDPSTIPAFPRLVKLKVEACMTPNFIDFLQVLGAITPLQDLSLINIHSSNVPQPDWIAPQLLWLSHMDLLQVGADETDAIFRVHFYNTSQS